MTEEEKQHHHFIKIIALFCCIEEESTYLIGKMKREQKMIFNRWRKETLKLVKHIESGSDMEYLDELKDKYHEVKV